MPSSRPALWEALACRMYLPSLGERLLEGLGFDPGTLERASPDELRAAVANKGPTFAAMFDAYCALADAALQLSNIHVSLILNYLVKPSKTLTSEDLSNCPVKPHAGVGGSGLENTYRIVDMRRTHPMVRRLAAGRSDDTKHQYKQ